jgi:hypothetical protein
VFSNCIIAEGLDLSTHSKGRHSKGSLIHDNCRDIIVFGNLYAHNARRNPYFKAYTTGLIANNLIYNPRSAAIQLDYADSEWLDAPTPPELCRVTVVGNVLHHGVDTGPHLPLVRRRGDAYLEDNLAYEEGGIKGKIASEGVNILPEKPVWVEGFEPLPASETAAYVTRNTGSRPKERDAIDKRIVKGFLRRKGKLIDSQDDVGGYPRYKPRTRKLDVPEDDLEGWLKRMATEVE